MMCNASVSPTRHLHAIKIIGRLPSSDFRRPPHCFSPFICFFFVSCSISAAHHTPPRLAALGAGASPGAFSPAGAVRGGALWTGGSGATRLGLGPSAE